MKYTCPCCGSKALDEKAWNGKNASFEICSSCGIEFGHDDAAGGDEKKRKELYKAWRKKWVERGKKSLSNDEIRDVIKKVLKK